MKSLNLLVLVVNTLLWQNGYAQSTPVDSLEKVLTQEIHDTTRLKILKQLVNHYHAQNNAQRLIECSRQSLALIDRITDKKEIGNIYLNHALATEVIGEYTQSLEYNSKALVVFKSIEDSVSSSIVLNNMGIGYNQIGDYGMAVYHLLRAVEIDEARKDTLGACFEYVNISESYYNAKNYSSAEYWARKSFTGLQQLNNQEELGYAAETLASAFIELGKLDSARILIYQSLDLAKKYNNDYITSRCIGHLGRVFFKEQQYDSARIYFAKVIGKSEGKNVADLLLPCLILLSETHLRLGMVEVAGVHAQEAYRKSISIKNKVLAMQSCAVLAQIYESSKKPTEAIYYLRLASLYQDTILEQSVQGSIQAKMFDLDLEKEKREKKQVLSVLTQRDLQVSRQRYILLSAGVALLSLLIIMFLIRKAGLQRQGINKLLMANNLQLNKLNQEVNGLINTIVHDLKSPLNSMQGLLYLLEQEAKENAEALLLIQQGNKVLTGGHEIIRQLLELRELEEKPPTVNPEEINLKEFMSALHEEHVNYSKQKKIELVTEASDTQVRIDRLLTKRLLTNLLSNAIKFSPSGKQVIMKATAHDAQVIFEIIDEGQGFTEADRQKVFQKFQKLSARPTAGESSHGLGLAIVHLLSQQLKATIDLKSESGKGATFTVSIPF